MTNPTQKELQDKSLQERTAQDAEQAKMQRDRNEHAQNVPQETVDLAHVDGLIKQEYSNVDQPGLHPANAPSPESKMNKPRRDLEDITGNPGHRDVNPNAPATSFNRNMPDARDNPPSINEPPGIGQVPSINEPPGSKVHADVPRADPSKAEPKPPLITPAEPVTPQADTPQPNPLPPHEAG